MNIKKFLEDKTYDERLLWFASARSVTIGKVSIVRSNDLVNMFVAKIHGATVSNKGKYLFDTAEEARVMGKELLKEWKEKAREIKK